MNGRVGEPGRQRTQRAGLDPPDGIVGIFARQVAFFHAQVGDDARAGQAHLAGRAAGPGQVQHRRADREPAAALGVRFDPRPQVGEVAEQPAEHERDDTETKEEGEPFDGNFA